MLNLKNVRWKKVVFWSAIPIVLTLIVCAVWLTQAAHAMNTSPLRLAVWIWRGNGQEANDLMWEDQATDYIKNPVYPALGVGHGYLDRATARVTLKKFTEAMADYDAAKKAEPKKYGQYPQVRSYVESLATHGLYDEAIKVWEEIITGFPTANNKVQYALFLARTKTEKYRDTKRAVALMLEVFASLNDKLSRYDHETLATVLASDKQFDEAVKEAELALTIPAPKPDMEERDQKRINAFIERTKNHEVKYATHY